MSSVLASAAEMLLSRGIEQWRPEWFRIEEVGPHVRDGTFTIAMQGDDVAGVFRLIWDDPNIWGEQPPTAGYIHNLAVAPQFWGQGVGPRLVREAERMTRERGRRLLRLDCWNQNEWLTRYYEGLGFRRVGDKGNSALFEKELAE